MSKRMRVTAIVTASAWSLLALSACGGSKQAKSPETCPEGTVLSGESCIADSAGAAKPGGEPKAGGDVDSPKASSKGPGGSSAGAGGAIAESEVSAGSYDKEAVDAQLKRAAKQVRANCGAASDEEGAKTGPWGSTAATI
ncbi:MAG TPA: hypothetical protein VN894_00280, partial [Polyangiaceae bacterium]|nr:hypothetical protein [Polyangiaceae bacterium]